MVEIYGVLGTRSNVVKLMPSKARIFASSAIASVLYFQDFSIQRSEAICSSHAWYISASIVDLPLTGIAQGHFLASVLGEDHRVRLLSPDEFFASSEIYDVALNIDSITELDRDAAERYADALKSRSACVISINHEANAFTAPELFSLGRRYPYWLRDGYVEEHFYP